MKTADEKHEQAPQLPPACLLKLALDKVCPVAPTRRSRLRKEMSQSKIRLAHLCYGVVPQKMMDK
jgi:hypothetical protein